MAQKLFSLLVTSEHHIRVRAHSAQIESRYLIEAIVKGFSSKTK